MTDMARFKQLNEFSPQLFQHPQVIQSLQVVGVALIAASILYLIAANWLMIPDLLQLAIPMLLLCCSAGASVYFSTQRWIQQSLDACSALLIGLSMAVIGQVYQTGADSYVLFAVWTVFLLPWLYRPNIGVFVLICLVSQVALYLYFEQSYLMVEHQIEYVLCLNILAAICSTYALKYYPALRFVFIALITLISLYCMFVFCVYGEAQYQWPYALLAVVLPAAFTIYFYLQHRALETSLQAAGLALSLSVFIFQVTEKILPDAIAGLLILAFLIFVWFALFSAVLNKLFPATNFSMLPLANGAWLVGIILASLLLTYWQTFSIVMGVIFVAVAWWMLRRYEQVFKRQFAYSLWVCGQTAVLVHSEILTDQLFFTLVLQIGFTVLSLRNRMHPAIILIQLLVSYGIAVFMISMNDVFASNAGIELAMMSLNTILLILLLVTAGYWLRSSYRHAIALWMLCIVFSAVILHGIFQNFIYSDLTQNLALNIFVTYLLPLLWLGLFILQQSSVTAQQKWLLFALGFVLMRMGYFEIFVLLVLLAWAQAYRHIALKTLCIVVLTFSLWLLYYELGMSFLAKSLTIFISGCAVIGTTWLFTKMNQLSIGEQR
jgi:hypothetical protein